MSPFYRRLSTELDNPNDRLTDMLLLRPVTPKGGGAQKEMGECPMNWP
jgi:hypothetical protein